MLTLPIFGHAQSVIGTWKTMDDKTGNVKSHVTISNIDGKLTGKVVKLINPKGYNCIECKGDKKDQPIIGMEILWGLSSDGIGKWSGGKIMDPENGKTYKCNIQLKDDHELNVRGYIGFSLLGRTQTWQRLKE